jgi:hypothetical protein
LKKKNSIPVIKAEGYILKDPQRAMKAEDDVPFENQETMKAEENELILPGNNKHSQ